MNKFDVIAQEWDNLAEQRFIDLTEGKDKSYTEILKPAMLVNLETCDLTRVLDIGCGVGIFTQEVAELAQNVLAIDVGCKSIKLAKATSRSMKISFSCINFLNLSPNEMFTTIYSNMSLMTTIELQLVFLKANQLLVNKGTLLFSITHPSFWPIYWNYTGANFNYNIETEIVREFKTRDKVYQNMPTHHYHRPVSHYINAIISNGLTLTKFIELKDNNNNFWYPRFLIIECKK